MGLYSILWSIDYRPEKMEINGKELISTHTLCGSNKDSFAKVTPPRPRTFVLTLSKMFVILRFISMKTWKQYLCIL